MKTDETKLLIRLSTYAIGIGASIAIAFNWTLGLIIITGWFCCAAALTGKCQCSSYRHTRRPGDLYCPHCGTPNTGTPPPARRSPEQPIPQRGPAPPREARQPERRQEAGQAKNRKEKPE